MRAGNKRYAAILTIAAFFFLPAPSIVLAAGPEYAPSIPAILSAAESLFETMKARDYPALWRVLTAKSRDTIVSETDEAIRKAGEAPISKDQIREDFAAGGPTSRKYWEGFLRRFDPDAALEKSRWQIGTIEKDRAEVLITHPGADRPAVLRLFLEGGSWKAGLAETFWER
ncbi:MAG: hypothetical protein AB1346_04590 [Thermodesulfobacteriota bacterium]